MKKNPSDLTEECSKACLSHTKLHVLQLIWAIFLVLQFSHYVRQVLFSGKPLARGSEGSQPSRPQVNLVMLLFGWRRYLYFWYFVVN